MFKKLLNVSFVSNPSKLSSQVSVLILDWNLSMVKLYIILTYKVWILM